MKLFSEARRHWPGMSASERFEEIVAAVLGLLIAAVVLVALVQLVLGVLPLLARGALDPLDYESFQALFGLIMTLLIALEFRHSIIQVALRRRHIIQVRTVLLIALLALSRKFILLDPGMGAATIAALAGATLALGAVYWLLREPEPKDASLPMDRD